MMNYKLILFLKKTTEETLFYMVYLLLFLLFACLASITMPELMKPTQTGKFFVFAYGLTLVVVLFLLHKLFSSKSIEFRLTPLDLLLGLLFLYITINRYFLQEVWGFSLRYYELIGLAVLYFLLRQMPKTIYPWLMLAIIISGIVQAVYGNLQLYGYFPSHHSGFRMTGSFFNPGPYAGFLAIVFPIAFGMYLFKPFDKSQTIKIDTIIVQKWHSAFLKYIFKYIPLIGVVTILLILPASQSRAAWLAVGLSTTFLLFWRYDGWENFGRIFNSFGKKIVICIFAFGLLTAGCLSLYHFKKDSADGRLLVWKITSRMIADHPFSGNGFDRFQAGYMEHQADYFQENPLATEATLAGDVYYAFNEPLQFTVENGIIGILILLMISIIALKTKDYKGDKLLLFAKAGLLSVFIFSLFSYPSQILPVKILVVLLLAVVSGCTYEIINLSPQRFEFAGLAIKGIFISGLLVGLLYLNFALDKLYKGFVDWKRAFSTYQTNAYTASLEDYKKAEIIFHNEGDFLMNYGKALSMAEEHEKAIEILKQAENYLNTTIIQTATGDSYKALGDFENAEEAYLCASHMTPGKFYPKYLLAKLYDEYNQKEKATKMAIEILEKKVKVESKAIEEIKSEMEVIIKKSLNQIESLKPVDH
jgi:O-antigen polymerase